MICDAPAHGTKYHNGMHDNYPNGSPEGYQLETLTEEFYERDIEFNVIKVNDYCDIMVDVMKKHHPEINVTNLVKAIKTQDRAQLASTFTKNIAEECQENILV